MLCGVLIAFDVDSTVNSKAERQKVSQQQSRFPVTSKPVRRVSIDKEEIDHDLQDHKGRASGNTLKVGVPCPLGHLGPVG